MPAVRPIAVSERSAAAMLDMKPRDFRRMVDHGALPPPVRIGTLERWPVDQIEAILKGDAARPSEDIEL